MFGLVFPSYWCDLVFYFEKKLKPVRFQFRLKETEPISPLGGLGVNGQVYAIFQNTFRFGQYVNQITKYLMVRFGSTLFGLTGIFWFFSFEQKY